MKICSIPICCFLILVGSFWGMAQNSAELIPFRSGEKWGYADEEGTLVIPAKYEEADFFCNGLAAVKSGGEYLLVDGNGTVVDKFDDPIGLNTFSQSFKINGNETNETVSVVLEDYVEVTVKNMRGLYNSSGSAAIPVKYDQLTALGNDLVLVKRNNQSGLFHIKGVELLEPIYDEVYPFKEDLARVKKDSLASGEKVTKTKTQEITTTYSRKSPRYGFVNYEGKTVIPMEYTNASDFSNGVAIVNKVLRQDGVIDNKGNIVVPLEYFSIGFIGTNHLKVRDVDHWALFDRAGKQLSDFKYQDIKDVADDRVAVRLNNAWGFLDIEGKEISKMDYEQVSNFSDGRAVVRRDNLYGYIDVTGKEVIAPQYFAALDYENGWAIVKSDPQHQGIIGIDGNPITEMKYRRIMRQPNGTSIYLGQERFYGLLDEDGKELTEEDYRIIQKFEDDLTIVVSKKRKYGVLQKDGKELVPSDSMGYDLIEFVKDGPFIVQLDSLFGLLSRRNTLLLPIEYEEIKAMNNGLLAVLKDGSKRLTDFSGEFLQKKKAAYDDVQPLNASFSIIVQDGQQGLVDASGAVVANAEYASIVALPNGMVEVRSADGSVGYVGKDGEMFFSGE